jgi:3-methylfumaryl-CoA hydratase
MTSPVIDIQKWVGRKQAEHDTPTALRIGELADTLDDGRRYPAGSEVPPGWHWILFHPVARTATLTEDGHAPRGGFLPPVTLPRRMWAGGRLRIHGGLRVDEPVERRSEILSVTEKSGRNGQLVFVTVKHELHGAAGLAIDEEQHIVYREAAAGAAAPQPVPHADAEWTRTITPNVPLLFRYSALMFVGHRIHYDRDYAMKVEGYGGLVVHGPLIATYLLDLARDHAKSRMTAFSYRGVSPLFDAPFRVRGKPSADGRSAELWAETPQGTLAMSARAEFD